MFSRYTAEGILNHITGKSAIFTVPTAFIGLFTIAPTDDTGAGGVEVSAVGTSYARVATIAANWNTPSTTTDPTTISNSATLTFTTASGAGFGTVVAFGVWDSAIGGSNNLLFWDWLGNFPWLPVTVSLASPGVFTSHAHGYSAADQVVFTNVFGGTAPTLVGGSGALGSNNVSAVVSPATDTFTLTTAATAVNTSATGDGLIRKIAAQAVAAGITVNFPGGAPGNLVLTAA